MTVVLMNKTIINRIFCTFCKKELEDSNEIVVGHHLYCKREIDNFVDEIDIIKDIQKELNIELTIFEEGNERSYFGLNGN
ncbi:MAG: hypothetical protein HeimC3_41580 [Candidatus Heimdallarchaeota archaeon LC_3]|nr:MAG: hypothetical protein HeimC3_41580 [Candidatus Heimdallarchaeota archaeon LC_3]